MKINVSETAKGVSSVGILKEYIRELPIKSMDEEWIREQKVDLDALMVDNFPGSGSRTLPSKTKR
jgi:hypothetical protein